MTDVDETTRRIMTMYYSAIERAVELCGGPIAYGGCCASIEYGPYKATLLNVDGDPLVIVRLNWPSPDRDRTASEDRVFVSVEVPEMLTRPSTTTT